MQSAPPSKQRPFHIFGTRNRQTSFVATDFLRGNDRMASLLPAASRMARLQADCHTAVQAFEELAESLPETTQNKELVAALRALAAKRRG